MRGNGSSLSGLCLKLICPSTLSSKYGYLTMKVRQLALYDLRKFESAVEFASPRREQRLYGFQLKGISLQVWTKQPKQRDHLSLRSRATWSRLSFEPTICIHFARELQPSCLNHSSPPGSNRSHHATMGHPVP